MNNAVKAAVALLAAATMTSGCASIASGGDQKVAFSSNPSDARVTVTDRNGSVVFSGATPAEAQLRRGAGFFKAQSYTVKFEKAGYKTQEVILSSTANGWVFGNLFIGGLIGLVIDGATGAIFGVTPGDVSVSLKDGGSADLSIRMLDQLTPEERATLVPIS